MKILVIGSGGREHAIVWKINKSPRVKKIFCAPGNAGISEIAECIDIKVEDVEGLVSFAKREGIDFTVVGSEAPLVLGVVDRFSKEGLKIFGPTEKAARLEGSKVFAKEIMARYGVPTADFSVFSDFNLAKAHIKKTPVVIKADGLCAGKGVIVAGSADEAESALYEIMVENKFGKAGSKVIIEDCLEGEEASILVFSDGKNFIPLVSSQDHKRVNDFDLGPNTGGMGAYSPAPAVTDSIFDRILKEVISPVICGMEKEGMPYRGVLYAGIMLTKDGPKVLEFNVRFGDPETQVVLPRMKSDLVDFLFDAAKGSLAGKAIEWDRRSSVCVVLTSGGYPGEYEKDKPILGFEEIKKIEDITLFHAGTKLEKPETRVERRRYLTDGGRVLGVTGLGNTIKEAIEKTYRAVDKISFKGMHYRRDIGAKALHISA